MLFRNKNMSVSEAINDKLNMEPSNFSDWKMLSEIFTEKIRNSY